MGNFNWISLYSSFHQISILKLEKTLTYGGKPQHESSSQTPEQKVKCSYHVFCVWPMAPWLFFNTGKNFYWHRDFVWEFWPTIERPGWIIKWQTSNGAFKGVPDPQPYKPQMGRFFGYPVYHNFQRTSWLSTAWTLILDTIGLH